MKLQEWKQHAFNGTWRGLQWQGFKRSTTVSGSSCLYRGSGGRCCAIGWLIPSKTVNELWSLEIVLERCIAPMLRMSEASDREFGVRADFLGLLQHAHDHSPNMEIALREIATTHGLKIPTPWAA